MGDFNNFGGSEEENTEIRRLNNEVEAEPDNFEHWEKLVRACEALEGGLNRNSSPQALSTLRDSYDRFLLKFPLLFGYWKKYADLEFNISGPESAEMIYERGCASITNSVDLWTEYCSFKMETTHVPHLVRDSTTASDFATQPCNKTDWHWSFNSYGENTLQAATNLLGIALTFENQALFCPHQNMICMILYQKSSPSLPRRSLILTRPHSVGLETDVFTLGKLFLPVFALPSTLPRFWSFPCCPCAKADLSSRLFERAASHVGLDFLAHPFWDKYLEYEERQEAHDKIFAILTRVIHIPMHQYARYYERFRQMCADRPLEEMADSDTVARLRAEVVAETAPYGVAKSELEVERDVRAKIEAVYYEDFTKTQAEVTKRWTYEAEIKRPYFHVTELDHSQLINWRKYLEFEEAEGDAARIVALYERCLVTCAFYEEFWFRYARWMSGQAGKQEEVRNIYLRATTLYVPVSRPGIRMQFAYFEESCGRVDVARDLHSAILFKLPNSVEAILSWANLQRRQIGLEAAIEVFKQQIDSPEVDIYIKAALVTEWAFMLWKVKGSVDDARTVFSKNVQWYADSRHFWQKWLDFELAQPSDAKQEAQHGERIKNIFDEMRSKSRISTNAKKELAEVYMTYLQQRGGKDAMKLFLEVDREMFGPPSVAIFPKLKLGAKENGIPLGDLDEPTRQKAEARYYSFYQLHADPDMEAQGTAEFH